MKKTVAIVTYVSKGNFDTNTADENKILGDLLDQMGISNELVAWSDPDADWSKYRCLLVKSVWDYFDYYSEFLTWMDEMKKLETPVLNDLEILRWNSNKDYLHQIEADGFDVIAGMSLGRGSRVDIQELFSELEGEEFVFKPKVSGGAKNTFRVKREDGLGFEEKLNALLEKEDFLAQPYIKEVAEVGEYSLIFFNSKFSHAVLKTPAQNDFRVQHYFGGQIKQIEPNSEMMATAEKLIQAYGTESLYVRVDGIWRNNRFFLMELEMIEPYLFLDEVPRAKENYASALKSRLIDQLQIPSTAWA